MIIIVRVYVCMMFVLSVCTHAETMYVEVRELFCSIGSLLPPLNKFQGSNSDGSLGQHGLLPAESSRWPEFNFLYLVFVVFRHGLI